MDIENLVTMVLRRRGNMGVRAAAKEIGISPTTLTRIEKGNIPDVGTLEKLCAWLGQEPTKFIGIGDVQIAFKNRKAIPPQTATALANLIQNASKQFAENIDSESH